MKLIKEAVTPFIMFIFYLLFSIIPSISDFAKKYNFSLIWTLVILGLGIQLLKLYKNISDLRNEIKDLKTGIDNRNNKISELSEKNSDLKDELQTKNIVQQVSQANMVQQVNQHPLTISGTAEEIKSLLNVSPSPYSQLVPNNGDE